MVFYKIDALRVLSDDETKEPPTRAQVRAITGEIAEKSESLFQKSDQQNLIFTVSIGQNAIAFGAICKTNQSVEKQFIEYANAFPFEIEKAKIEEVTFGAIRNMLSCAYRNDYIGDDDDILDGVEIELDDGDNTIYVQYSDYAETSDETPQSGKVYYTLDDGNYVIAEDLGDTFEQGVTYYEVTTGAILIDSLIYLVNDQTILDRMNLKIEHDNAYLGI